MGRSRQAQWDLHLLGTGDAPMPGRSAADDGAHLLLDLVDTGSTVAAHHIVREVRRQLQLGHGIEQIESEVQIVSGHHAVAVRFSVNAQSGVADQSQPAFRCARRLSQRPRPKLGWMLVVDAKLAGLIERRLQAFDIGRKACPRPQAPAPRPARPFAALRRDRSTASQPVEAGGSDGSDIG